MHSSRLKDKRGWRLAQGRGDLTDASLAGLRRAGAAHQHRCRSIAKRAKSWSVAVSLPDKDGIQPWRGAVCSRRLPISALEVHLEVRLGTCFGHLNHKPLFFWRHAPIWIRHAWPHFGKPLEAHHAVGPTTPTRRCAVFRLLLAFGDFSPFTKFAIWVLHLQTWDLEPPHHS